MRLHAAAVVLSCLSSAVSLAAQNPAPPPVFPARADLVRLDVVVRDKAGRLVDDLRSDEVQVFEDGKRCTIESFRLVQADRPAATAPAAVPGAPLATSTAAPGRDAGDALVTVVALVFDQLGPEGARNARAAALELAGRSFPKGSVFAVFKVGQGLAVLQSFTEDRALLPAAIEEGTTGVDRARDPARSPNHDNATEEAFAVAQKARSATGMDARFLKMEAQMLRFSDRVAREGQGQASLQPLLAVARGLSLVQGRKSLLYFSEGVAVPPAVEDLFRSTVSAANRANVSIYAFDARGLRVRSPNEETKAALDLARDAAFDEQRGGGTIEGASAPDTGRDALRLNRQGVLGDLAESTGGFLVAETNDLRPGLERVLSDLRSYYDVGYVPPEPKADGRWRDIEVKVSRPGVVVRTRRGYYAMPPGAPVVLPRELALAEALAATPMPRDFDHRAATLRFPDAAEETEMLVWVEVPLAGVSLVRSETRYHGRLSVLGHVRNEAGKIVARLSHDAEIEGPVGEMDAVRERTSVVKRTLRLAPGRYVLETAVQDRESGRLGARRTSFEVPASGPALRLGSLAIVRAEEAGAAPPAADDPLRAGSLRATPLLGRSFPEGTPTVSLLLSLYAGPAAGRPEVELEFRRDGATVAHATPELPAPDATGRITYVGSFPTGRLGAGRYEVWVRGRLGDAEATEATAFTIAPRATALGVPGSQPFAASAFDAPSAPAAAFGAGSIEDKKGVTTPLATILERAGRYVQDYERTFSNLVAEETYRQWGPDPRTNAGTTARTLRSDLVFVRLTGPLPWGTFRDVYEVDGQKVRDRERRLEKLFFAPKLSDYEQAQAILNESSRYNLGRAYRNVNAPTLGLLFMRPENQARLAFKRKGTRSIASFPTVEVAFEEKASPSLVHDRWNNDVLASGRFWIDETRGTVLRTEVEYDLETDKATRAVDEWERGLVSTEYRRDTVLGCFVPDSMTELYSLHGIGRIEATARYANYRRFDVSVGTAAALPLTFGRDAVEPPGPSEPHLPPASPQDAWPAPMPPPVPAKPVADLEMVAAPEAPGAVGTLLQKAGEYVVRYEEAFRNVVAVEESTQVLEQPVRGMSAATADGRRVAGPPGGITRTTRGLRSEIAFVMLPGPIPWTAFRDVVEVDGLCVAEGRPGRLEQLLKRSPSAMAGEAEGVDRDGRKYALGPKGGTTSVLTMTLGYLHPDVRDRFAFERKRAAKAPGQVELAFAETTRPPLAHATAGGEIPARGTVVLREADGAILRTTTEFRSEASGRILRVTTDYRLDPDLELLVPAEMNEVYETTADADTWPGLPESSRPTLAGDRLETTARYSAYRRVP